jgi:hypothetical protein
MQSILGSTTAIPGQRSASHLSRKLKVLVTSPREVVIEMKWSKNPITKTRVIIIRNMSSLSSLSSPSGDLAQHSERGDNGDGKDY